MKLYNSHFQGSQGNFLILGYLYNHIHCCRYACSLAVKCSSGPYFSTEDTISYKILEDGSIFSTVKANETTIADITEHTKTIFTYSHTNAAGQTIITTLIKSK